MALINCSECEKEISDSAPTCPHCGTANTKDFTKTNKILKTTFMITLGFLAFIILLIAISPEPTKPEQAASEPQENPSKLNITTLEPANEDPTQTTDENNEYIEQLRKETLECQKSRKCWSQKFHPLTRDCITTIESLATYGYSWKNFDAEKFPKSKWADKELLTISYGGDNIKFQDSSGEWINMIYECEIDTMSGQVLDIKVYPGSI